VLASLPIMFNFLRDELVEIIDWLEDSQDTLLFRFPGRTKNIKYGAQLTVRESQAAIFVDEGAIADVFGPGLYPLTTENMPVLSRLRGWAHGFRSPFLCDVYFVSTRQFQAVKWGTPNPILMRDPELKQVRVRAFGSYTIRISDPAQFLREFAGTGPVVHLADLEEKLRHGIVSHFSDALAEQGISVFDLARNTIELGERLRPLLQPDFSQLGLDLLRFFVEHTTVPPEVEAMLDKATELNVIGDNLNRLTQLEMASSIRTLAANEGSGAAALGAQVAMGAALAQQLAAGMPQATPSTAPRDEAASRAGILSTIKELASLRDAGALSEDEFQKKKAELLSRL
jgi:membrane protease subunit (stomatin/prohibitin family)